MKSVDDGLWNLSGPAVQYNEKWRLTVLCEAFYLNQDHFAGISQTRRLL
jgi:hypothetical protein